ncbi:pyridoxamine 5'-phosphate oxidase family protein [Amycolatopsis sp. PS_44_ISF1]|uniref:pyridoxamine 5'-phosphate oxidase family protein n=1 Tax=Amycolatopsis sp. PS_44_ISF1 TaxID=2974917 RepID=UPI0028DDD1DD|nr:pyridoxamine 5'-phosphate oxidase family protein [Amycolatopsis sp. PS_44_ISF1]MDT8915153.1 pyridoxamine 5'-phosphate oxidase family protein [Amycolatopsis sp. PS_44_ISF1]
MSDDDHRTVTEIAREVRTAMITSRSSDGKLMSRPMTTQQVDFDGTAWFFVSRKADLVAEVARDSRVNIGYAGSGSWLSLSGTASVVDDENRKKDLWNEFVEAWFPGGPEDQDVVLLKVDADSAEFWNTPGGKPRALFAMAKARLTGTEPDPGDHGTVSLEDH